MHAKKKIKNWEPREGEVLVLWHDPDNVQDKLAVTMIKGGAVVGHVPKTLAPVSLTFWSEAIIKVLSRLQQWLNCGSCDGFAAAFIYRLYGPEAYLRHLKELVDPAGGAANINQGRSRNNTIPNYLWLISHLPFLLSASRSFVVGTIYSVCFTKYGACHISGVLIVSS